MNCPRDYMRQLSGIMRRATIGLVLVSGSLSPAVAHTQKGAATAPLVFDKVTVVDVEHGQLIPNQQVVIVGNRIQAMGKTGDGRVPSGARVVDARGKYLIPGLWDMHTHSRRATDSFYPLFIANGVTGIRDAGSEVPLDTLRLWRQEIVAGTRVGPPRQILSGQSLAGEAPNCRRSQLQNMPQTCVADSADARHVVDSIKAAGADMIKPRAVTMAMYFVIAAEARRLGIPFGGHAEQVTALDASDSGASIVDHAQYRLGAQGLGARCWGTSASLEQCQPIADKFKHNGTWWVPTLIRENEIGPHSKNLIAHFNEQVRGFWSASGSNGNASGSASADTSHASGSGSNAGSPGYMQVAERTGLPILAGTDVGEPVLQEMPPGFSLHVELAMYAAEGLTPTEVLQTATLNPAKFLHATDSLGTVAPGKLADLVLLDADPLKDINNTTAIRAVVANGRYFDRAALDQLLADVRAKAK